MSKVKAALKAAKSALDSQDFANAASQARTVLDGDPQNYFGHVFLGRALEKQNDIEQAIETYRSATTIKSEDELAWKGLCNAYESLGANGVDGHTSSSLEIAKIYADKSNLDQCQAVIDKLVEFAKSNGSRAQYKAALQVLLPGSPVFDFLEGRIPNPSFAYVKIAEITEAEEKEKINKEIGERRTRLGAKLSQVSTEVHREVFAKSELEKIYHEIINWAADDDTRHSYEEKLFSRAFDHLVALSAEDKSEKRDQVLKMASDIVIIKQPFLPAWQLNLEWKDLDNLRSLDAGILREFISFFPESGLSKVFQGYLGESAPDKSQGGQTNGESTEEDEVHDSQKPKPLGPEERLLLLVDGVEDSKTSVLASRIMCEHYLKIEEYESSVEMARSALRHLHEESRKSGLHFQHNRDAINTTLATALVYYQSPKNHPEAESVFTDLLKRQPNSTAALLGLGLILEEQMQYDEASKFLDRALERDLDNLRIGTEAAWCKALTGDKATGLELLESYLEKMEGNESRDLRALTLYRIGRCIWDLSPDKASRRDRNGAYARFLASLKANPNFAPAYTSLGLFYGDYRKDKKRARQCFQRAFDLSASEVEAAERLAGAFADDGEWEIVEIIAQRVIDSGMARPSPGSKRKAISWPFAALGVVQINKQEYPQSVISFQAALRISPRDYYSWVGLGESYHSSGRYVAARRTLEHAQSIAQSGSAEDQHQAWFAEYMLSNVLRELGDYDEAISGYNDVSEKRPNEFGVSIALLQTLVDQAWQCVETGFFARAVVGAVKAIETANSMAEDSRGAFNFWKALGDSCALLSALPGHIGELTRGTLNEIFSKREDTLDEQQDLQFDGISFDLLNEEVLNDSEESKAANLKFVLCSGILAFKEAVRVSSRDRHAQAVAWYNLGWMEYQASISLRQMKDSRLNSTVTNVSKAAVRCFKGAIEMEAGNADFWNALGIVTTNLNPRVAQHSFVRSLHLNSRSARTWTNLGALYLIQDDRELAHQAFARAQSTDPDYAQAWIGEGLIALLLGDAHEALSHFVHAAEISDSSSVLVKRHYVISIFDSFLDSARSMDISKVVRPIFALQQLQSQDSHRFAVDHLISLLQERVGDYSGAIENLEKASASAEAKYEQTEDSRDLGRFAVAKADLARNYVAIRDFEQASENVEIVLNLTSEDSAGMDPEGRLRMRLSAHLTAGLAKYNLDLMDEALESFRAALEESQDSPEVVCLLAQVLWAKGSEEEKNVAESQLFECIEKNSGHPKATQLIGAMAAIEGDSDTAEAVSADLQSMRTDEELSLAGKRNLESLIATLAALRSSESDSQDEAVAEAKASVMLLPSQPNSWSNMAEFCDDPFITEMALKTATQSVPPNGDLDSTELSKAFAAVPTVADAQRSIMTLPWGEAGWNSLKSCIDVRGK